MARILVTGSAGGLGLGAARRLTAEGHEVIVHARTVDRARDLRSLIERGAQLVTGDLSDMNETRGIVEQVSTFGKPDAVIHNAGVISGRELVPVNVVAPYLLTVLLPAARLVYLSSSMHRGGRSDVTGVDWSGTHATASYSDSKLLVTMLAAAVGRVRRDVYSNAVDPGWVPTRMGGPGAPDDLELGHRTQAWLAAGEDPATHTSAYWHHQRQQRPDPAVTDPARQDALLEALTAHTGVRLDGTTA
ncbi:MAG TPA: SDR family NAD(P)-dependent oxidoreductase [Microbacterium sp.]|uniref:SDR family NAD(P)-dependent oxidoreductase n=1 Tax=Microbacterium sp. TaxID=51671 RepID=UPI002F937A46